MAEDEELAAVEELLWMDAVWAEPPADLHQRIHTELHRRAAQDFERLASR